MKSLIRVCGLFLVISGLGTAVYFYGFFDISVETPTVQIFGTTVGGGRVANLSLMEERQNGIIFGFGEFLVGAIVLFWGRETTKMLAPAERICPYCAEHIKVEAKFCRYCQKDLADAAEVELVISAASLYSEYASEMAGDARYKGKRLTVAGTIESLGKGILDTPYVLLGPGEGVQCFFTKAEEHLLTSMQRGMQIEVVGECRGKLGSVLVKECQIRNL